MTTRNKMRVLLGMSGGFDSSYAAHKLISEGYTVEGALLVMHEYTDIAGARAAAKRLSIPLHVIDCKDVFSEKVEKYFISEYKKGRTPNPCIVCNPLVKFLKLYEYALEHGFDRIATGHYAKILRLGDRLTLVPPVDSAKDQSYMLAGLSQKILASVMFPLSDLVKSELRSRVEREGLPILDKADSQEICFIPNGKYSDYLKERLGEPKEGSFIDKDGNVLGAHSGIYGYTVGQRKGLGISLGKRMFVGAINPVDNTVTLLEEGIRKEKVGLSGVSYMGIAEPLGEVVLDGVLVKIRYAAPKIKAVVRLMGERAEILFDEPVTSPAPGQSAVIYSPDGAVLASGFID